jgi:hypothetical protein
MNGLVVSDQGRYVLWTASSREEASAEAMTGRIVIVRYSALGPLRRIASQTDEW